MLNSLFTPYQQAGVQAVQESYVQDLINRGRARSADYIRAREYYDGVHRTQLTSRTREFLNLKADAEFNVNYCPTVVNAKADRLSVSGFDTDDKTQADILWKWWRKNRMDRTQGIVHRASIRDGDAFVLVEWDNVAQMPRFYFEPAYAGDGVMVYYSEERRDDIQFASKHWRIQHGENAGKMRRINLYFPDRIEKYISHDDVALGNWMPYMDDETVQLPGKLGNCGCVWFTDTGTETGKALGIPIIHFKHNDNGDCYGTSHLANVMPVQDVLNKSMIDLIGAMDVAGFGLLVGTGADWTATRVGPGAIVSVNTPASEASLTRLAGDDPAGLLAVYNALVMEIARVSGTPLSYFQSSGQVAAEGTMKQQEVALVSQVKKSQIDYGNAWEDVLTMARRLYNVYGQGGEGVMDEDELIDTVWDEAESRNEMEQAQTLSVKVGQLGVSEEQAQTEMGYDATQIAAFKREKMRKQAMAIRSFAGTPSPVGQQQAAQQNMTQTENANGATSATSATAATTGGTTG